jgi:hypothetical protein
MKKTLLIAILALSINAFAQTKQTISDIQHLKLNSMENVQGRMQDIGWNTSGICSEINHGQSPEHQAPEPFTLIQIIDSIFSWQWDTLNMGWELYFKSVDVVYDDNHNLIGYTGQEWNGSTWVYSYKFIHNFDANNNQTSYITQEWYGSEWVNVYQYIWTYNANNYQTSTLYQSWNGINWENDWKNTYSYDANNIRTGYLRQDWNGSAWVDSYQYAYTYDANNNQTSSLKQTWNGSTWENSYLSTHTYDASNNRIYSLGQYWSGNAWENSFQSTYTYDANNNQISEFEQVWNGTAWENSYQSTFTYDSNNNQTSGFAQIWSGEAWVNSWQYATTYDTYSFYITDTYKWWNDEGTEVIDGDSSYYYSHGVLGIDDLSVQEGNIHIYPNPTNGKFTISSNSIINSIEIFNLLGELVPSDFTFNQQTSTEIDISNAPKGIYFAKISTGGKVYTRKIVVQ